MKALVALTLLAALPPPGVSAAMTAVAPVRRFALVIGANRGASDRVPLRYAVTDAERFADILIQMGGVQPGDSTVLRDPGKQAFLDALATTGRHAGSAQANEPRVEVLLYFSGHADDQGLMLGREMLSYRELREAIHAVDADLGITILDACASGAITRLKGGQAHPAFLTGASNGVKGYAFLTSSSENEAAQESERLRASFFTHALLSGLRGAADVSGDGRVTLNEAYQFAFNETLVQTTTTQAGAQHPAYDIKMAGTGEVVMTDVRQTSASLILSADYDGRFLVLNAKRNLVAELYKPQGRTVELGLEPGAYEVYFEQQKQLLSSSLTLADGQRRELVRAELKETRRLPARSRGLDSSEVTTPDLLDGRLRAQVGWNGRFAFSYWLKPSFALQLTFGSRTFGGGDRDVLVGAHYYAPLPGKLKPHAGVALGRFDVWRAPFDGGAHLGIGLGVGVDLYLGRRFSASLDSQSAITNGQSSIDTWVSVGWSFGGRRPK